MPETTDQLLENESPDELIHRLNIIHFMQEGLSRLQAERRLTDIEERRINGKMAEWYSMVV